MTTKNQKRRIIITKEQEEKMAAMSAQKIQAFLGELAQVQSRRVDLLSLIVSAQVTHGGIGAVNFEETFALAKSLVDADSRQKWTELAALFAEMAVEGPQPHLEWAAAKVGVELFPAAPMVQLAEIVSVDGVDANGASVLEA